MKSAEAAYQEEIREQEELDRQALNEQLPDENERTES